MRRSETAVLLAKISAFDQRTIGESDVEAWTDGLEESGIPLTDAMAVVTNHFRTSHDRIMPVHIIEGVRAIRRERLARYGPPPFPRELDQAQERAWAKLWWTAIRGGEDDPIAAANAELGISPVELLPNPAMARAVESLVSNSKAVNS